MSTPTLSVRKLVFSGAQINRYHLHHIAIYWLDIYNAHALGESGFDGSGRRHNRD